jgi:hypothetical protein
MNAENNPYGEHSELLGIEAAYCCGGSDGNYESVIHTHNTQKGSTSTQQGDGKPSDEATQNTTE